MERESMSPKLVFQFPFDELASYEAKARGYLSHAFVEFDDGGRCPVVFCDPVRLKQDLDVDGSEGRSFIAEPGMIVVPEVTREFMKRAVESLFEQGFFNAFKMQREK